MAEGPLFMSEPTDEELLQRWARGQAKAFDQFAHRHAGRVKAYAMRKGIAREEADDVLQDVFLKLHRHMHTYEPERAALPWFFTLVHNTCLDRLRARQRSPLQGRREEMPMEKIAEKSDTHVQERSDELKVLLANLTQEQRSVVEMRVVEELSFEEMQARTGKSAVSLRKAYSRTLALLKETFSRLEKEKK
jgi:RNA polymerase sigma-70 factor, ECF subfamily